MSQLNENEYHQYYRPYIDFVIGNGKSIVENLEDTLTTFLSALSEIPTGKPEYQYAAGKWTPKEIVQHLIDTERVFAYRALRFARNDAHELPGFDQNDYVANFDANARDFHDLLDELKMTRKSTIWLFKSFGSKELIKAGHAGGNQMSVRALGYVISGHLIHHLHVINERYL